MRHLLRTTALSVALVALAGVAHAQDNSDGDSGTQNQMSAQSVCDTPWANVDGNEDGFVSRDEASAALDSEFGQIDADGNDEITKTEWVDCRTNTAASAESDRSADNFADVDANQDSGIDPAEFRDQAEESYRAYHEDRSGSAAADGSTDSAGSSQETASADGDAVAPVVVLRRFVWLTPEEAANEQTMQNMSEDEVAGRAAANFGSLDTNSDGILDTQEWSQRSTASMNEDQASASFDRLDADSSGSVTREEYMSARNGGMDGTTTSSTTYGTDDEAGSDAQASDQAADSGGDDTVPVFIYRFMPY